jgi:hypothetical protein
MKSKNLLYFLLFVFAFASNNTTVAQQVIVTDDASYTSPANGAMLDVKSTSKGFMPPRVALTSLTDVTTIASPATGLFVYCTGTGGLAAGVYYWNGTIWAKALVGGSGTSYLSISDNGTVTLNGGATTFTDLVVPVYSARNSTSSTPAWSLFSAPGFFTFEFQGADVDVNKEVFFNVQLPHDYKAGSTLYPHVHWSSTVALGTTRPVWKLEYQWVNLHDAYSITTSNPLTGYRIVSAAGTDLESATLESLTGTRVSMITPLGSIDGAGKSISSMLVMRLTRLTTDANDLFTGGAYLISFDIHYEVDSFGSGEEYTK